MISRSACVAPLVAVAAGAVAVVQLREGIVPMLDTATYWSGAHAVADGHPFTTTLAPSFSNFDAAEFLSRGGRLPFVDFPLGYPTLAGVLGILIGVGHAMGALTILAVAVVAALVVIGPSPERDPWSIAVRAAGALGLVLMPTSRLVTQATLSEPLFCAVVVGYVVALLRYRRGGGRWWLVAALAASAGLLRFIGAPLALLAGVEHFRRHRRPGAALAWTVVLALPAVANALWTSAAGGGHSAGWRGLQGDDVRVFARSVAGWLDAGHGDMRLTYFGGAPAAWWAWPLTLAWIAAMVLAVVQVVGGLVGAQRGEPTSRRWLTLLPPPLETCLAAAAVVTAGLVAGMLGFDALVTADNRLMLPAGVLTVTGLVWTLSDAVAGRLRAGASSATGRPVWWGAVGVAVVLVWVVAVARPWNADERFSDLVGATPDQRAAASAGARIVIANDADGVHWYTGIPAAYVPLPTKSLTGETVDTGAAYRALPCPLYEHGGVIVLADAALFGDSGGKPVLDSLVTEGILEAERLDGVTIYRPTEASCG